MTPYVSLLRGINVGGRNRIPMDALVKLYESLGFTRVRTYLQSGNVVFESPDSDRVHLAGLISEQIRQVFGFPVTIILRDSDQLFCIVRDNPFLGEKNLDTGALYVTFLSDAPLVSPAFPQSGEDSVDRYALMGKELYLSCSEGYSRTKFSNSFFERVLKQKATTRNWKTVTALVELIR